VQREKYYKKMVSIVAKYTIQQSKGEPPNIRPWAGIGIALGRRIEPQRIRPCAGSGREYVQQVGGFMRMNFIQRGMRRIQPVLCTGLGIDRLEAGGRLDSGNRLGPNLQPERFTQILGLIDHLLCWVKNLF